MQTEEKQKLKLILLIDDDPAVNFYNKKVIENGDCAEEVMVYENAANALEFIKTNMDNSSFGPGLILLDLNMPYMDGWEFLEEYRQLNIGLEDGVMIVMLTTSLNTSDRQKAFKLGVDGYALKPLTLIELQNLLQEKMPDYFHSCN